MAEPLILSIDARVRDAIEALYHAFAKPVPLVIEGCPCCLETRGVDVLLTTPLRDLTGEMLWRYVSGVFYTVGSERDFRYFLPRILELAITDPGNSNNTEIILTKVGLANWQSWPPGERRAIEDFIDAWFEQALAHDLVGLADGWYACEAESVLCGAARADLPLAPWLARLQQPDAALVLESLKERFPDGLSPFWEDAPAGLKELSAILITASA
jgi:hypothetical protein